MGKNMLVFHNASNTSYANYADNLTSISSSTTAVTLRFIGQGASATATATDAVVLTVTAGKEEEMVELIAGAVAEARSGVTVVADDENSKYLNGNITAVSSISTDTGAGLFKNIIDRAFSGNDVAFTNAESGSVVLLRSNGGTATISLPSSPVEGFNLDFYVKEDLSSHNYTMAGSFDGVIEQGDASASVTGTSSAVFTGANVEKGDYFRIVYSNVSSKYYIHGIFDTGSAVTIS
tara:strand:- start:43 stop:747 length:705 start_codon:yes stop_codon:yes gene_type:complete